MKAPLNYFLHSYGPATKPVLMLDWVFTAICCTVCLIVCFLLLAALFHKRKAVDKTKEVQGKDMHWVYWGTGLSTLTLFGMVIYALIVLDQTATPSQHPALTISVTGYDWWWEAVYDKDDPQQRFTVANEIHIPTHVPVLIKLQSADVIHAFWVPQLAGKTQMIPGMTNQQWLQADEPGIYRGQCTQYCGVQHAHMAFEIIAENAADFSKWKEAQRTPSESSEKTAAGQKLFMAQCSGCHTVRGTEAEGSHGPDLTHLGSRRLIAAGMLTNTPQNQMDWVMNAQDIKPGARMPSMTLSDSEAAALNAYLTSLK